METLAQRMSDKNKTPLYMPFVEAIREIASNEELPVDIVWQRWTQYAKDCLMSDQSPVITEFCQWNKFKLVQVI